MRGFLNFLAQSPDGYLWAGADTTALSGLAKDVFEQGVTEGVNNSFPLAKEFPTEAVDWKGGDGLVWAAHVGRNASPFFAGEDSAYPVATSQQHVKGRIDMRKLIARIRMTEEAMNDLVSSEASFRNGMTDEKTRLIDDVAKKEEYSLSNDGRGVLAQAGTAPQSATTLPLINPGGIVNTNFGNRFIFKNQILGAVSPQGVLRATSVTVTGITAAGTSVICSPATGSGWLVNDYIVQMANLTTTDILDSSYEKAFWGLTALVDDGTFRDLYFGVSRTDYPNLQSYVVAATGAFSLDLAQRTADVCYEKLGGEIDLLVMHPSVRREYIKLVQDDRRYVGAPYLMKPDAGTAAMKQGDLTLGEIPIKAIRTIGLDQIFYLDTKKSGFKRYVAEPGKFMDRDGTVWLREGTGATARHAYEATYFMRKQYFCKNPGYNGRNDGVSGQTLIVVRDE
jgi:hypothetical protein